ncbi:hypothetical protein MPTK1_3g11840 [Marchantia polymorpha subsp. ruderalis]|uniref:Uncharacterized protein n=2 Tax=Marchantia polymorpha TaxID=3197 RepID=A0AAF6AZU6_MARPO|nr:hypothetical protein MARPO_0037s0013 [Marchantia polymorpha]BBN05280.1 hypothetical protein Mp_3g11840 [Marchantia polymorpha subsp. ruderalis]|eukprot:PTQ40824.1 hypothetical protein MARPO_0037s0013 [Marchantia polymorpha]
MEARSDLASCDNVPGRTEVGARGPWLRCRSASAKIQVGFCLSIKYARPSGSRKLSTTFVKPRGLDCCLLGAAFVFAPSLAAAKRGDGSDLCANGFYEVSMIGGGTCGLGNQALLF